MHVLEFCGIPGAGKSTQYNKLIKVIKEAGYNCCFFDDWMPKNTSWGRIKRRLRNKFFLYSKDARVLIETCKSNGINLDDDNIYNWFIRLLEVVQFIKRNSKSNNKVVIVDEGIVMCVASMSHDIEISENVLVFFDAVNKLLKYEKRSLIVCHIDIDEAVVRLKKRNRNGDRFLSDDDSVMRAKLRMKDINLNHLISRMDSNEIHHIDMNEETSVRIFKVLKLLD